MRRRFAAVFVAIILLFALLTYYVGLRGWEWLQLASPWPVNPWVYWAPLWLFGMAFPAARFAGRSLPRRITDPLAIAGGYWLSAFVYLLPLLLIIDLAAGLNRWVGILPPGGTAQAGILVGGATLILLAFALAYGRWQARNPVIVRYELAIPKALGRRKELRIALASDTHTGTVNGRRELQRMVQMINGLEPDLVLLAGDLMDDDFPAFVESGAVEELQGLAPRLGTFAVLGNHDHGAGHLAEYRRLLEGAGVQLLVDQWVQLDQALYLIGRDDPSGRFHTGRPRKPLVELMEGIDPLLPLILMDHQPSRLEEAERAGIDLQVSGHTHRGQLFPFHLITRRVFELDWGYLKKGAMHVVVSLGYGTWGPPIRLGNRPEVVLIQLRTEV